MKPADINFCGLCRSGNHPIIFWLLSNIAPPEKLNKEKQIWHDPVSNKYVFINNVNNLLRSSIDFSTNYKKLIYSFEDIYLIENNTYYICRDFLNMMASRIKKWPPFGSNYAGSLQNVMNIWINHNTHGSPYAIYYNKWLTDKDYRDEVASRFGLENNDTNFSQVSDIGEGSSFVGEKLDEKENYMKRYKNVEFHPMVKSLILNNKELIRINKRIYNIDIEECLS